jgi:hypothetical protein
VGYVVAATTPTYKGFDTFLGYYRACNNDLFYHSTSPCEEARCAALPRIGAMLQRFESDSEM